MTELLCIRKDFFNLQKKVEKLSQQVFQLMEQMEKVNHNIECISDTVAKTIVENVSLHKQLRRMYLIQKGE